jgi:hypothetical protein
VAEAWPSPINGGTTAVSATRRFREDMLDAAARDLPLVREQLERQYEFSVSLETVNTAIGTAYVSGFESGYHEAIADLVKRGVDVRLVRPGGFAGDEGAAPEG